MKVSCSKAALVTGVQTVYKAVSPKATIPVLSGILMETTPQGLRLLAYDLDLGIETFIPAAIETDGAFVVPAKLFSDITRRLPHAEVTISYREDAGGAEIVSDRASFLVKTMAANEFPSLPEIGGEEAWSIQEKDLKAMIKKTAPAAAVEDNRAFFTGIYTIFERESITMVATDTFRMAHRIMKANLPVDEPIGVIIPAKTLLEVERNLSAEGDREVAVAVTDRHAMFRVGNTTYVTRLLEGQFPNYKQLFPKNIPASITCDRLVLSDSIERVATMCKDDLSAVRLEYTGAEGMASGFLTLTSTNPEMGQGREDIPVSMTGSADVKVALRARYLRDVLRVLDGDEVTLGYTSFRHPIEVKDESDPSYTYLVMPVTTPV